MGLGLRLGLVLKWSGYTPASLLSEPHPTATATAILSPNLLQVERESKEKRHEDALRVAAAERKADELMEKVRRRRSLPWLGPAYP